MEALTGLLSTFLGTAQTVYEYPWVSLAILLIVAGAIFNSLSDAAVGDAARAVWNIISLYFSTPYAILRRILRLFRSHEEREDHYKNTLEFVTFRWTRFIYLGVLLGALAILSIGIAASVIALYPKIELEARNEITKNIDETTQNQQKAKQLLDDSAKPGFKEKLKEQRLAAEKVFEKAQADYTAVLDEDKKTNGFNGGAINIAGNATSADELKQLDESVAEGIKECPGPNYTGFTEDQCQAFQKLVKSLIAKRTAILDAWKEVQEKTDAERNTQRVINEAERTLKETSDQLTALNKQLEDASKYFGEWLPRHLNAFVILLLQTLAIFFVYVWAATIFADIASWFVKIMLALEKKYTSHGE